MVLAQTVLALPIVTALVHSASADLWAEYGGALQVDGATRLRAIPHLLAMARRRLVTAVLAGFGRTISEVGAILIVGGNIAGYTRTMTTTIVLETSKGNLSLALGLGFVLIGISVAVSATIFALGADEERIGMRLGFAAAVLAACVTLVAGRAGASETIVLASTTSVENSGLLARILPEFADKTGISVRVLAQGTGQALATAARGDADLVLVHDPEAEQQFIAEGHGAERRQIAWNDFIVVGPRADPAHIAGGQDAVAAFTAIAKAGAPFVSRGDKSGTDALEHRLWRAAEIDPAKTGGGSWYRDIGGGMGAALNTAAAMGAYTLSDRGTWLSFGNKRDLAVLVQGDPRLLNRYDVILLDPKKHPEAKQEPARRLADWLASAEGQAAIGAYEVNGEQLFHPSAAAPK